MSAANVTKLKKQGMPVDDPERAQAWRVAKQSIAHRKRSAIQGGGDGSYSPRQADDESHDQARTRREIAEANLAELRLRELRGELIRREVMERTVGERAVLLRESVLQVKARIAPLLAAEGDVLKITSMLDAELRAALDKASD